MFDEPNENESPTERASTPADRARERSDEFRMHAELAAVFEGHRKWNAEIRADLDPEIARDVQRTMARLEKSKVSDTPVIDPKLADEASRLLALPDARDISRNDYHIHRRPGETMIVRWIAGDEVEAFYERLQAHFDAALAAHRDEERQAKEWKQDEQTLAYLKALDAIEIKMPQRYLRDPIRQHKVFVLSTQTADEIDILHLCDFLMGVDPAELVGQASAPSEAPTERDRAWFFKLFSLRGVHKQSERMCFFTFLQKADDTFGNDW